MDMRKIKQQLRSLGRSLRPFEEKVQALTEELEKELDRLDSLAFEPSPGLNPIVRPDSAEARRHNEIGRVMDVALMAVSNIQEIRTDVSHLLRPQPKVVARKASRKKAIRKRRRMA